MKNKLFRTPLSLTAAVLLVLALLPRPAYAAGASLSGSSSVQAGNSVTLTLSVNSKIYGLTADLNCGSNLTFTNYTCSVSGWSILVNQNHFSVYGTSSASGAVITVTLKVSSGTLSDTALSASFDNIVASDGDSDIDLGSASWSGKVAAAPSGDCSLSAIIAGNFTLNPAFSPNTTYYTAKVPYSVEKLNLDYNRADKTQSVSISGTQLAVGLNTVTLKVTAANGATRTYTIEVTREQDPNYKPSSDATLSQLGIEGAALSPAFSSSVRDYIAYVPFETTTVKLSAAANDSKASGVSGTGDIAIEDAMTRPQALAAMAAGMEQAALAKADGVTALGIGEMGIGNTSTSAAVLAVLTGADIETVTGRGGGLTDRAFARKKDVLRTSIGRRPIRRDDAVDVLCAVGGLDIAAMTGAFLGCAHEGIPAAVDGFISVTAALCAVRLCPATRDYLFLSHDSYEIGYRIAAEELGLTPCLHLGMRLGEGSGCPLLFRLLEGACGVMRGMATFAEAAIHDGYLDEIRAQDSFTVDRP